ncbi:MAG: FtsX-like permease family protein [Rhodanobacteraceae bacterium]
MHLAPILSTLRRHKIITILLVLEIALSCAIVCNAVFLITQRLEHMRIPSGVAEDELVQLRLAEITPPPDQYARARGDLDLLRRIPGVKAVATSNQAPFAGNYSSNANVMLSPDQPQATLSAATYFGENLVATLGLKLQAGRALNSAEYRNADVVLGALKEGGDGVFPMPTVITRSLAERLWPGDSALGKLIYLTPKASFRVVGIVARLARANAYDMNTANYTMIIPLRFGAGEASSYVLRTRPQDRDRVLKAAAAALVQADPQRVVVHKARLDEVHRAFFQDDRAMAGILLGVILALLTVTALGIVGLASFWVAQRRKQIGVRRALGATRRDILQYFQTENLLIVTLGIALGMALAWGVNLWLMQQYETARLPVAYLPIGAIALWLLGQMAVLAPALRASRVPPALATRTV